MAKDAEDKERIKAERLREALRANLRRRKVRPPESSAGEASGTPPAADSDPGQEGGILQSDQRHIEGKKKTRKSSGSFKEKNFSLSTTKSSGREFHM